MLLQFFEENKHVGPVAAKIRSSKSGSLLGTSQFVTMALRNIQIGYNFPFGRILLIYANWTGHLHVKNRVDILPNFTPASFGIISKLLKF